MSQKTLLRELFYLLCWLTFPISTPLILIFKSLKFLFKKNYHLQEKHEEKIVFKEITNLSVIARKETAQEIAEKLIFEISSDIKCNRKDKAIQTLDFFTKNKADKQVFRFFRKIYFLYGYHLDPDLFETTMKFLSRSGNSVIEKSLKEMINKFPLNYNAEHLEALLNIAEHLKIQTNLDSTPLLTCYLAKDFEKIDILLSFKYDPFKINGRSISYQYTVPSPENDFQANALLLKINPEFSNLKLSDIFAFEGIEIKRKVV